MHFIDTYDEYTGKLIENNIYGEIVPKSFAHIIFGKNVVDKDDNGNLVFDNDRTLSESVWRISDEIVLDYHKNTNKNDYTAIVKNGKSTITTDKFNGIYINGVFLERDGEDREKIKELLKGNVIFEEGSSLVKHVGKNVTSTLAANSINMNGGKITQRVLDNLFVTNANRIEITNIFTSGLSEQQKREIEEKGLLINGEQASGSIKLPEEYFKVESIGKGDISGWNSWHEYNPLTGDVTLIFERIPIKPVNPEIPDKDNLGLQGGYAQSIDKYTQSNVDIINTMYIKNQGHNYARKIAFIPKVQSIINQQIIYPEYISDKGRTHKLGKENILSPVAEIVEVENGEAYDSLQIAEIFGDYGKYTGDSSSKFNYDTWGITGGTFHRFNEQWLSGLTYGYAKSKVDYKTGEGGKENIDTIGLNLFLAYEKNNWLSINSFGYSWNKHDLSRKIYDRDSEVLGKWPIQTMTADFDSHLISIGTELGYRYLINEESYLYPYIGLDYIWYTRESYKESGDSYALDIDASKLNTLISKIGLIYEKTWNKISGFGDIGWQHYFSNFKSFNGKFYNESLTQYEIEGLDIGKDVGYIRVGLEYNFTNEVTTGLDYTATFRKDEISNKVGVNIQYKW
ncbi:autotransporter outer membrane beta-barrel domain-containing protein [Cetobacterium somerae]|uniref:autotransporter outer membrane beta-barrel domain-containing protein n=1 Tax=Cetobacterium somerae TaxID=188913 RepID=UPI003892A71D